MRTFSPPVIAATKSYKIYNYRTYLKVGANRNSFLFTSTQWFFGYCRLALFFDRQGMYILVFVSCSAEN